MRNEYKNYLVRFWNHYKESGAYYSERLKVTITPRLNDCAGNSVSWRGKARTEKEAIRKARKKEDKFAPFRLYKVETEN